MKKLLQIVCAVLLCIVATFSFTACNLLKLDTKSALSQEIIKVNALGTTKKFTRNDLLKAYQYYGYQYYQNSGDLKSAVQQTADTMVQRWALFEYIEQNYIDLKNYKGIDYTAEIRYRALDSMQKSYAEIEVEVRKDLDKTVATLPSLEVTPLRDAKVVYQPQVYFDEEAGKLVRNLHIDEEEHTHDDGHDHSGHNHSTEEQYHIDEVHKDVPLTFEEYNKQFESVDSQINGETWSRYIKKLQAVAKSEERSTEKADVLAYEQARLEAFYKENVLLELYEEYFMENLAIETDEVVKYYKEQFASQYALFNNNISAYHNAVKDSSSMIYYHPDQSSAGYMSVQHILIKFGSNITKQIDDLKAEVQQNNTYDENGNGDPFDDEYYLSRYNMIISNVEVKYEVEENGQKVTKTDKIYDVLDDIKTYVSAGETPEERLNRFDELIYVYNDDTGNVNSDFFYSVYNEDNDEEGYNPDEGTNEPNGFNEHFADASREFLDAKNNYEIGDIYVGGDYQGLVVTSYSGEYAAHILIYGGQNENFATYGNLDNLTWQDLNARKTSPTSDKTVFQYIYDILFTSDYFDTKFSENTTSIIETIMSDTENTNIVKDEYKYKDMWS